MPVWPAIRSHGQGFEDLPIAGLAQPIQEEQRQGDLVGGVEVGTDGRTTRAAFWMTGSVAGTPHSSRVSPGRAA